MSQGARHPRPRRLQTVELPPGGRVGRYTLCYRLAHGGMGSVFLARMSGPGRFAKLLALKLIHPHLVDQPEVVEMFLEEARLQSQIHHPNVCAITDFGQHEDNYFMAMEYLEGETLQDFAAAISERPELRYSDLWISVAAQIVREACEGLHAAHELRGPDGARLDVIHRDVAPDNLFVTYAGSTKVVDFGVARSRETELRTMPGSSAKGRYGYMAPERARATPYDRRVDVWSLGVILWELLAFRPLFGRENPAQTLMAAATEEVPSILAEREDVPKELALILDRALARDPEERYPTARDMGKDLLRLSMTMPDPVGPAEVAELMEAVFAERLLGRRQIVAHARQLESGNVMSVDEDPLAIEAAATAVSAPGPEPLHPALLSMDPEDVAGAPWTEDDGATLVDPVEPAPLDRFAPPVVATAPRSTISPSPILPGATSPSAPTVPWGWLIAALVAFFIAFGAGIGVTVWLLSAP